MTYPHPTKHISISAIDHIHLTNLGSGLLRTVTPDHIATDFIMRGLAKHATGGLMLTDAGQEALYKGLNV